MEEKEIEVTAEYDGIRLDRVIPMLVKEVSRSYVQKLIEKGEVFLNDSEAKNKDIVRTGDLICFELPEPEGISVEAEEMPLTILYEDTDIIVVDKPKGIVVHPAAGHYTGTLVNGLLYHCGAGLSGINGVLRPGIVHRIDKDTTGVLVVCKNDLAHRCLAEQFRVHSITRIYSALVYGSFEEKEGRVEGTIARDTKDRLKMAVSNGKGKFAATNYTVKENFGRKYAYIECRLETGRTHQIRVHMTSIGHPLLGDCVYGPKKDPFHLTGQALHAGTLGFLHPRTNAYMEFHSPLPDYFITLTEQLRKKEGSSLV